MEPSEFQRMLDLAVKEMMKHGELVIHQTINANKYQPTGFDLDKAILNAIQKDPELPDWYKKKALDIYKKAEK
jgi:hypothetical protein